MTLKDKFLGSSLGIVWAILQPALYLALYTFAFSYITNGSETGGRYTNIIFVFTGIIPYLVFSEAISSSANSLIASASIVKNIVFKSETIPIAFTLSAVVPLVVGISFLLGLMYLNNEPFSLFLFMLIPIAFIQFFFLIGIAFLLSSIAVFFRDVIPIIPTIMMMFLFFTPIFYSITSMPEIAANITFFNPLYQLVTAYRAVIIFHSVPNLFGISYLFLLSVILNIVGISFFKRLKGYFELVL